MSSNSLEMEFSASHTRVVRMILDRYDLWIRWSVLQRRGWRQERWNWRWSDFSHYVRRWIAFINSMCSVLFSLFSVILVYFIVGVAYNGLVNHKSGVHLLPQAQFWIGLPVNAIVSDSTCQRIGKSHIVCPNRWFRIRYSTLTSAMLSCSSKS